MSDTILLVGHGSRDERGNAEIEAFAAQWRKRRSDDRIDACFIEFSGSSGDGSSGDIIFNY